MNRVRMKLETERDAVVAKLATVQDQLYLAGRNGRNQQEIERLRAEVLAALDRRESLDRLILCHAQRETTGGEE